MNRKTLSILALYILLLTAIQLVVLNLSSMESYFALAFIFSFFLLHSGLAIIVRYTKLLMPLQSQESTQLSFESFCERFEISPRESDIVREICKGYTNKEISEHLFISLQTVKDHTHRIYIKTGARNRVELINRLKEVL